MSRLLLALLVVCAPLVSKAAFTLTDPKNVFADLATWRKQQPFETTMVCGQSALVDLTQKTCTESCSTRWCIAKCESPHDATEAQFGLHIDECKPGLAHVFGDNGLIVDVTKADYLASGGTWAGPFLKSISTFLQPEGNVEVQSWHPQAVTMIENGRLRSINGQVIEGRISFGGAPDVQTEGFELLITDELDGARQILWFQMGIGDDLFFLAHGLISRPYQPPPIFLGQSSGHPLVGQTK